MENIDIKNMLKGDRDALAMKMLGADVVREEAVYMITSGEEFAIISRNGEFIIPFDAYTGDYKVYKNKISFYTQNMEGITILNDGIALNSYILDNATGDVKFKFEDNMFSSALHLMDNLLWTDNRYYIIGSSTKTFVVKAKYSTNSFVAMKEFSNNPNLEISLRDIKYRIDRNTKLVTLPYREGFIDREIRITIDEHDNAKFSVFGKACYNDHTAMYPMWTMEETL
ncbi:MAG: hypothetical protein IJ593_04360 [Lachnospiraceae bacterium]|nr:hypothetical protein [Lachnospiraceae bacterium]